MKIHFISLGCPKNLVDSEKIIGALCSSGIEISTIPEDCDVIVINTCGFIKPALEETEDEIQKAIQSSGSKRIYVYGCAVNRAENELRRTYPQISGWFRLEQRLELLRTIKADAVNHCARLPTTHGYAYLKIAEGCSNHCSYCTIPSIKGEYHSLDLDTLVKETIDLAKLGIKEIILIAQDTTQYGLDLSERPTLVTLIRAISKIPAIQWIRVMYAHPKGMTDDILSEIESNSKVCKYIDMPIQHINDRILCLMNRGVSKRNIQSLIARLKAINQISLRTTVIAGFPTETDDEFKELLEFLEETGFDWLGVFPYYLEKGTAAAQLEQLSEKTISERYSRIISLQKRLIDEANAHKIGMVMRTLIHGRNGHYIGHTEFTTPEIDGHVVTNNKNLKLGNFYNLKITHAQGCDLHGTTIQQT